MESGLSLVVYGLSASQVGCRTNTNCWGYGDDVMMRPKIGHQPHADKPWRGVEPIPGWICHAKQGLVLGMSLVADVVLLNLQSTEFPLTLLTLTGAWKLSAATGGGNRVTRALCLYSVFLFFWRTFTCTESEI